jgi:deoxycytidylate deaminase
MGKYKIGSRPEKKSDETDYSCTATVRSGGAADVSGTYDSNTSTHAEMAAVSKYVGQGHNLANITLIEISEPCCTACRFVLDLLGLIGVVSAGDTYKDFTGSWRWPDNLRNPALFYNSDLLRKIRAEFGVSPGDASHDAGFLPILVQEVSWKS